MKGLLIIAMLGVSMVACSQIQAQPNGAVAQPELSTPPANKSGVDIGNRSHLDEDFIRLQDIAYWTGLVEEYERKKGYYPLQNQLNTEKKSDTIIINIQDNNASESVDYSKTPFRAKSVNVLLSELSHALNRPIEKRFDRKSKLGYKYFVTHDGYLLWVICRKCGVTPISTLLLDGSTPTVNIASKGMVDKVYKAQTRKQMLSHPLYRAWVYYFDNNPAK